MAKERVLREATIADQAIRYQVLSLFVGLVASIIGIVALPIAIPLAFWYWGRYYGHLRVVLTTRELKVNRGVLVREEKSIPLEKITDLAIIEGPVMRWMGLKGIKVETAGQSSTGALVSIVGIDDTEAFRDMVLDQRDRITDRDDGALAAGDGPQSGGGRAPGVESGAAGRGAAGRGAAGSALAAGESAAGGRVEGLLPVLTEIRDALHRIEAALPSAGAPTEP